ncbi:helix-turn-helix transcriptional regulator [Brevundimonas lenta]|uniref:Putative DNA-binding transcriptional regulator YafY n=1 Tax=Brevundimonas lenta TaxID=424796 RepID=A0A7W6JEJ2_9CAUL|nr:WYL domain-containing protein [Brevundimonas lenta]MBB4083693.1 putative DNA-binding transcriptional regulator YafY [Brevundimonas lenta]
MRASRLLSILLILQTRGRTTAETLAAEFEVSVRTIYRDIDQLSAAGAPVYADRGRSGGFQLMDGYRTRLTGLTDAEAETLFLGGLSGPAAQMGFSGAVTTMQLKLLAALPPERQAAAERLAGRFHLDPVGWYQDADEAERLPVIAQAVWTNRPIAVRYESWKGEVARTLEPLGLILKGGLWYLAARAVGASRGEPRTYRVSNILELTVGEETFERPAGFDLAAWWAETSKRFEAEIFTGTARLRLTEAGLKRLAKLGVEQARIAAAAPVAAEGWVEVEVPIESVEHAATDFQRLGAEAEVLAPEALRVAMKTSAARLSTLYAD